MQIVVYTHLAYVRIESNNVNTQIPTTGSLMDPQAWLFGGHAEVIK